MMRKTLLAVALCASLNAAMVGGVAVLVEDEPITLHEVSAAMREHSLGADEAAKLLVRKKLESIEATTRGLSVTSQEVSDEIAQMARQNNMSVMEFYQAVQQNEGTSEEALKTRIREGMLNQKLYNAIAFSQMEQPTAEEETEYYNSHRSEFSKPGSFTVLVYRSASKEALQQKVSNPMRYLPEVSSETTTLKAEAIDPRLAQLLSATENNAFTPVLPGETGFVSFYMQSKNDAVLAPLDNVRAQITNALMTQKRQQVLNDYFTRLQLTADVKILRLP